MKERGLFAKEARAKRIEKAAGVCHSPGSLYEYQNKGDRKTGAGRIVRIGIDYTLGPVHAIPAVVSNTIVDAGIEYGRVVLL